MNLSIIQNKLSKPCFKSLPNFRGAGSRFINLPDEKNFRVYFIDMLPTRAGAASERESEFGKRYSNSVHTCYDLNMTAKPWFVYIIENEKGHLYTGITTDPERRFREHASSPKGAKFFHTAAPVSMVFQKKFPNRSLATKFECFVKKLNRKQILELIETKRVTNGKKNLRPYA